MSNLIVCLTLDPVGNIGFSLQIVILFLLILGLPFVRGSGNNKNLMRHGYLTTVALVLHSVLIGLVMIPVFTAGIGDLSDLSLFSSVTIWSHVILGTVAEILGAIIVASWVGKGASKLNCFRHKKWMAPLFIIWVISIINGALIHILGLM
jgi:hypothetical protein